MSQPRTPDGKRLGSRRTPEEIRLMRKLHNEEGMRIEEIAAKFETPYSTTYRICKYITFRNVLED